MAQLFGKWTIKSHIEVLAWFDESKIEIIKELHKDWKNWLLTDEVKYKEKFNQIFFWDLLEYENRTHRIPEWTIPWAGSADITLWNFTDGKYELENIQVVCELKWAKTNLTKKQFWHGWLSPVGQGFAYKTGLKNCKRLIVSNFYEIRLYRDNTTDFEIRNLDELLDSKDKYFNLRKLYLLLHRDNLLTGKTEYLLSHFREEQKGITTKFYKEYKMLRVELINDMKQHNDSISIDVLIEKAQKIIDRLIFIFFCEDKGLLPDKKLSENILRSREAGFSSWEVTRKYFCLVDKGSEQLGIPNGYNGGLFKTDEVLDTIEISDSICRKFVELTNYDFDDKLSVNVLWHIFEQSITDLEEIKEFYLSDSEWNIITDEEWNKIVVFSDPEIVEKKWRRKKDWIFYTPEYIVDYIVQNSVMKYLNEKEDECLSEVSTVDEKTGDRRRKKNIENPEQKAYLKYQQILQNIKVLDPACGSGAFLVRVFDVLLEENKRIWSILNSLFDETETYKNILTNNIYGVDLNEESVEITKLSLRLKSAQKGKKLNNLDANIKCGNSLIDDPKIAGDKAFDWNIEFKEIMKNWWFDVIIWNPPYVRQELLWEKIKWYYKKAYPNIYNSIADLYVYFYGLALNLIHNKWIIWFISPNKWLERSYWYELRKFLKWQNIIQIVNFWELKIFEDASTEPMIVVLSKDKKSNSLEYILIKTLDEAKNTSVHQFQQYNINDLNESIWSFRSITWSEILKKFINKETVTLKSYSGDSVYYWIKTWMNKAFIINEVIYQSIINKDPNSKNIIKKLVEWDDFNKWNLNHSWRYLINTWYDLDIPKDYPAIYEWLSSFLPEIKNRSDQWKNWWNLRACDYYDKFDSPKLIYYHTALKHNFYYDTEWYYISANCYMITWVDRYLQCILNSSLFQYVKRFLFPAFWDAENWGRVRLDANKMYNIPIKNLTTEQKQKYEKLAINISEQSENFYDSRNKFFHRIQDNLKIQKLTKKLESFYEWKFKDFLDELKKQKISLSLSEQDDREPYFKEYKEKVLTLKGEIDKIDKEIDGMVFDLYGLSEEERKVVLNW